MYHLGFTIARSYWSQGYASESARTMIQFALGPMQLVRVEAVCLPVHHASAHALTKAGMHSEGLLHHYQIWRGEPRDRQMYAVTAAPSPAGV
ncbi:MAG: N-acetyltransferase [Chloroflexia bacterium]|nr:N-acetyltransferase [Chloroflexia bacterium]